MNRTSKNRTSNLSSLTNDAFSGHGLLPHIRPVLLAGLVMVCLMQTWSGSVDAQMANTRRPQRYAPWVSYDDAMEQTVNNSRPVMLMFNGSDWSPESRAFMMDVLTTHEFAGWSSQQVVKVEIDFPLHREMQAAQRARNEILRIEYQEFITELPTILFIDSTGSVIGRLEYHGGETADQWLDRARRIIGSRPIPDLVA